MEHMSRTSMILQALLVAGILGVVILIGFNEKDKEYISYTRNLRTICNQYMKDKKTNLKFNETELIFLSDLVDKEYLDSTENKWCIYSVSFTKGLIFGKYKANKDCTIKDENETENDTVVINETIKEE